MEVGTKVIILSDLNWERHLRVMRDSEVDNFTRPMLNMDRYISIARYYSMIKKEKPHLVLLSGDITGDGSCGHGYHNPLKVLIQLITEDKVTVGYISGNHDEHQFYDPVSAFSEKLENCHDLNNKVFQLCGLNIIGVPYSTSHNKRKLKRLITENPQHFDIVLAHSELKRRIWHLDFNCDVVLTGHYDRKLCMIDGKIFIALDNDSNQSSYAILAFSEKELKARFSVMDSDGSLISYTETKKSLLNENLSDIVTINSRKQSNISTFESADDNYFTTQGSQLHFLKYLRGQGLKMSAEYIRMLRTQPNLERKSLLKQMLNIPITPIFNCTKSMINDYLGKKI